MPTVSTGKSGTGSSFASYNYPTRYLRHYDHDVSGVVS